MLLFCPFLAFSQTEEQRLFDFVEQNYKTNIDSVQQIYSQKVPFFGDSLLWFYTFIVRSNNYAKDLERSNAIIEKHLTDINTRELSSELRIEIELLKARTLYLSGHLLESAREYKTALADPELSIYAKASTHINFSLVFWELGYFEDYKTQCELAFEAATKAQDSRRQIIALRNLAEYHETISHDYTAAKRLYQQAESLKGENPQLETRLRLDIRRAVQLVEFEQEYALADSLLSSAKIQAQSASLNQLYESANWALMRSGFLKQQYQKEQRQYYIQLALIGFILISLLLSIWYKRSSPNWRTISAILKPDAD